jgi:hypothetical protein
MTDYDEVMPTPERSEEELIEMVRGEFSGPVTPPPANDVPEPSVEFYEEQASLYEAREAESTQDAGAFFDFDEHEAAEWTATVRDNKPTIVKTSDLSGDEKDEARRQELLAKQREKQRKKIDEALAVEVQDDPLIASLNKSNEIKPVNYVIQSLIPERAVGFLVGESGAKKTFAALQMAICVATGIDFGGLPVRQGSVMYFAPEDASGVRERYAGWKYTQNKNEPLPNFWVLSQQVPLHRSFIFVSHTAARMLNGTPANAVSQNVDIALMPSHGNRCIREAPIAKPVASITRKYLISRSTISSTTFYSAKLR